METDESNQQKLSEIRKRILKKEREKKQKLVAQRKKMRPQYLNNHKKNNHNRNHKNAYTRNMNVHIIETEEETNKVISRFTYTDCVGFDCEGIITLGRTGKLSLIQICTEQHIYLFDICKMNYKIPTSLQNWLSEDKCTKFIHDSRQDQDALYHCYGISLKGIFDTTISDLIHRVWIGKAGRIDRLKGMDSLANCCIHNAKDYKVLLSLQMANTGKFIKLGDLKGKNSLRGKTKMPKRNEQMEDSTVENKDNSKAKVKVIDKKWTKIKVNCFDQKQNIKAMMRADPYLWAKRPLPINLVIYAAVDGYVSLLMGQYFRKKFKQWMIDKTLFISAKWCRMVARQTRVRASSAKVANSIVKLIRSNTSQMQLKNIPSIDTKFKYKREREAMKLNQNNTDEKKEIEIDDKDRMDLEFDNLLLLLPSMDFVVKKLNNKMNPNEESHEDGIMKHVTDVYKLNYHVDDREAYVSCGKLNYNRLIPLKLIEAEKNNWQGQ